MQQIMADVIKGVATITVPMNVSVTKDIPKMDFMDAQVSFTSPGTYRLHWKTGNSGNSAWNVTRPSFWDATKIRVLI